MPVTIWCLSGDRQWSNDTLLICLGVLSRMTHSLTFEGFSQWGLPQAHSFIDCADSLKSACCARTRAQESVLRKTCCSEYYCVSNKKLFLCITTVLSMAWQRSKHYMERPSGWSLTPLPPLPCPLDQSRPAWRPFHAIPTASPHYNLTAVMLEGNFLLDTWYGQG